MHDKIGALAAQYQRIAAVFPLRGMSGNELRLSLDSIAGQLLRHGVRAPALDVGLAAPRIVLPISSDNYLLFSSKIALLLTFGRKDVLKKLTKHFSRTAVAACVAVAGLLPLSQSAQAQVEPLKNPVYGVTLDDLTNLDAIVASLQNLPYRPTVRVVFDPGTSAADYYAPLLRLHAVAYVMGEVYDSYYFPTDLATYKARTQELVSQLKNTVDVWEIANEINGEWLRNDPNGTNSVVNSEEQQIGQMVAAANTIVKSNGGKTAITLYYNDDSKGNNCWAKPQDYWKTWPTTFLPSTVRQQADYALFSYYPYQDCPGLNPSWKNDFAALESIFPNAKVGFGEIGTSDTAAPASVQQNLITTYYPMVNSMTDPRFIGGFFWWNYVEEMLPYSTSSYFQLLRQTIITLKSPN